MRSEIIGRNAFEVFPGGSSPERANTLRSSLQRASSEDTTDTMMLQRYDVEIPGSPGGFQERYRGVTNTPLLSSGGTVCGIVRLQEVTSFIEQIQQRLPPAHLDLASRVSAVEAQLLAQTHDVQEINQRLHRSQAQERLTSEALRETVRRQRETVSDTSHDMRAPLTGLQLRLEDALEDCACRK